MVWRSNEFQWTSSMADPVQGVEYLRLTTDPARFTGLSL
jgi:hypothetical protein